MFNLPELGTVHMFYVHQQTTYFNYLIPLITGSPMDIKENLTVTTWVILNVKLSTLSFFKSKIPER